MRKPVIAVIVLTIIGCIYYIWNPEEHNVFPRCMFLQITGFQCPACGNQRALHQLLHGNLVEAFQLNAFTVILSPWLALILISHFIDTPKNRQLKELILHRYVVYSYLMMFVIWWIVRNIP